VVNYLWIALGAIVGASLRYFVGGVMARMVPATFPYGTLLINLTGSFVLGFFLISIGERVLVNPHWRLLVAVGFCGSYTTFSTYAFETFALGEQGQWLLAGANIFVSNLFCLGAVLAGAALARRL
jgi:fluoride exporter